MIKYKSKKDIEKLAEGGRIFGQVLDAIEQDIKEGVLPTQLDRKAQQLIREAGCQPSFLNYAPDGHDPFPAALCVSVNDAVVHGLPNDIPIKNGDVVGIDLGLIYENKYYLDSARTVGVGSLNEQEKNIITATKESLAKGISAALPGNKIGDISNAIQTHAEQAGFEVVKQLVGHGVGFAVHEPPQVPNFGAPNTGEKIKKGLVIAIEPMLTTGDPAIGVGEDGWSVKVKTGQKTAHFEHTIAITKKGPVILTTSD